MGWIKNIKEWIGNRMLKGLSNKKTRTSNPMPNFDAMKEVGIVYKAGRALEEEAVSKFADYLRQQGKKVFTLGYVDVKELPPQYHPTIYSQYFWRASLNAFNLPDKEKIHGFIHTEFDLLLSLFFEKELALQSVAALSKSKFSMGANMEGALPYHDFLIDTGEEKDLMNLGMQMIHYLKVIHQK
jgi:hypothetical protein